MPDPAIWHAMGLKKITAMVQEVYLNLGRSPIAHLFPPDQTELLAAATKSALFWATVCGGPPLYEQQFGPPRMKARHLKFPIDEAARQSWLACWEPVLAKATQNYDFPAPHLEGFRTYLLDFSLWMVNS